MHFPKVFLIFASTLFLFPNTESQILDFKKIVEVGVHCQYQYLGLTLLNASLISFDKDKCIYQDIAFCDYILSSFSSECTLFIIVKHIFMSFEMSKCNFELLRKLLNSLKLLETFQILNIKCWKHSSQSEGDGNLVLSNFHIYQRIPIETLELNTEIGNWISISTGKTLTALF